MFPVIEVPEHAAESPEWMGTKEKFWFSHPALGLCLFKLARANTGEDWSEKLAAEICTLLRLPHAEYHLASWSGRRGTVSPSLVGEGETLIHGNELLVASLDDYPRPGAETRSTRPSTRWTRCSRPSSAAARGFLARGSLRRASRRRRSCSPDTCCWMR